jgi:hypothetical protein
VNKRLEVVHHETLSRKKLTREEVHPYNRLSSLQS